MVGWNPQGRRSNQREKAGIEDRKWSPERLSIHLRASSYTTDASDGGSGGLSRKWGANGDARNGVCAHSIAGPETRNP